MPGDIVQSVLRPASAQAASIHGLWLTMLAVCTAVFVAVLISLAWALARGLRQHISPPPAVTERRLTQSVAGAVTATVMILLGLLIVSVRTGRAVASPQAPAAVTVAITGHQWWWEVEYEDGIPARRVVTANEIHIPTNRPVVFKVTSRDVIHSFWAPNLQGKRDLIPGYTTAIWTRADRPGIFRGQCAEFCGLQHAHMAFTVVAEPEQEFARWLDGARQPAAPPRNDRERRGRDVFMSQRCSACHTVRGTEAHGQVAPDLTHVASRSTIGAGTLPNTPQHLTDWVRNPQASKPGNQMPPNPLDTDQQNALMDYLRSLR